MYWRFWYEMLLNFHEEKFESLWFLTKFVIVENSKEYFVLVKTTISLY